MSNNVFLQNYTKSKVDPPTNENLTHKTQHRCLNLETVNLMKLLWKLKNAKKTKLGCWSMAINLSKFTRTSK